MSAMIADRVETLLVARAATSKQPQTTQELARALIRFSPASFTEANWNAAIGDAVEVARAKGVLDASNQLAVTHALVDRLGKHAASVWPQLSDKQLPLVALGVSLDDTKATSRIKDRDSWTAAIAGRLLGMWTDGAPPSLSAVCDGYAWRQLGLAGRVKRCPPEIRALFLQRELKTDGGPPDRLLRLFVARELEAPRSELRVLRDTLVRNWLVGRTVGAARSAGFASDVRTTVHAAHEGVFGDRKVFISSVWSDLRRHPTWSAMTLDDFKRRLLAAHRAGEVVLARADLVAAMNPELVASSEIVADGASFHFIVRDMS